MSHSTKTTQSDILNSQSLQDENQSKVNYSNEELLHREPIEHSPLWLIGNKEMGYFITIKEFRISEIYKTIEEARQCLDTDKWNVISRLIGIIITIMEQEKERELQVDRQREENKHQENG